MRTQTERARTRARQIVVLLLLLSLGAVLEIRTRAAAPAAVPVSAPAFRMIAREKPNEDPAMREHLKQEKENKLKATLFVALAKRAEYERLVAKAAREKTWDALARCESGGNWNVVDRFGGGLGIYIGTWRGFGGLEFASNPGYATKEQQIIVAERVYARYGFDGWGCAHNMGWV
jgi:hypothetical protein